MVADNEELEKMDAFQIHALRTPKGGDTFIFPVEDGTVKLSGGVQVLRTSTLIRDNPDRGEEQGNFLGESEVYTNTTFKWRTQAKTAEGGAHDSRMDERGCGFGPEAVNDAKRFLTSIYMYYWDPSGPNRKSCAKASWASGLSPEEPSLVTMTTSDTCVLGH